MDGPRPRRRRPATRGLPFGAPLDRRSAVDTVPIALIGEATPVAPPRVVPFGAMVATLPLFDPRRLVDAAELDDRDEARSSSAGPAGSVPGSGRVDDDDSEVVARGVGAATPFDGDERHRLLGW